MIEELKLLFLKCRKPNTHIYNALITSIYPDLGDQLYKEEVARIRHECSLKMSDFRHKYLKKLSDMAKDFNEDEDK